MSSVPNSACSSELGMVGIGSPNAPTTAPLFSVTQLEHSKDPRPSGPVESDDLECGLKNCGTPSDGHSVSRSSVPHNSTHCTDQSAPRGGEQNSNSHRHLAEQPSVYEKPKSRLNRIAEVRKSQGLSERTVCKRLNIDLQTLRQIERPDCDLSLSELMVVQAALEVPLVDLLEDNNSLARPIQERAKLVRIMKTVAAIEETPLNTRAKRLVLMLREQLTELMPELAQVGSWPQYGSRRGSSSIARVLEQEINVTQIPSHD